MKSLFLISFIAAFVSLAWSDSNAELDAVSHLCMAETKVTEKEVEEFYSSDAKFDAGGMNVKCHLKCVMEKLGEFKDGVLDVEKMMKDFKEIPELAENRILEPKIFENCKNEKGPNECETAYKITKCLRHAKVAK